MTEFEIKVKNHSVLKAWESLEDSLPEAMKKCKEFLQQNPEDRIKSGGKLKKLKGIMQYDITDNARIHYTVDARNSIVTSNISADILN